MDLLTPRGKIRTIGGCGSSGSMVVFGLPTRGCNFDGCHGLTVAVGAGSGGTVGNHTGTRKPRTLDRSSKPALTPA
jgi:hypothetical protein